MTEKQWLDKYEKALISYGLDKKSAHETRVAASDNVDLSFDPECAAADEVSYMQDNNG
jgi:hypothetical protein